jgi:hypothetical protein
MKKLFGLSILMLITALLLFGCSGGNGGNDANPAGYSSVDPEGGNGPTASTGFLLINFVHGQTPVKAPPSRTATLPAPDKIRVVVRNGISSTIVTTDYDAEGEPISSSTTVWATTYKQIADIAVPGSASIPVDHGTGYLVDIISYQSGARNVILKYGNARNINIVSGQSTTVFVTLNPIDTTITAPASVDSGTAYTVAVNNNVFPLRRDTKNLRVSTGAAISDLFDYSGSLISFQLQAPILGWTDTPVSIYYQGLFFIDDELLDPVKNPATDVWSKWAYYYPNPTFPQPDPDVSTSVAPPGAFILNVTL